MHEASAAHYRCQDCDVAHDECDPNRAGGGDNQRTIRRPPVPIQAAMFRPLQDRTENSSEWLRFLLSRPHRRPFWLCRCRSDPPYRFLSKGVLP